MANKQGSQKSIDLQKELIKLEKDYVKQLEKKKKLAEMEMEHAKNFTKSAKEAAEAIIKQEKALKEINEDLEKRVEIEKALAGAQADAAAATANVDAGVKGVLQKSILLDNAWRQGIVGAILDSKQPLKDMGKAIKKNVTAANFLGSTLMTVVETMIRIGFAADTASANINKVTGQGRAYGKMAAGIALSNAGLGLSIEDVGMAYGDLYSNFSKFSSMSSKQQSRLTTHAAKLERFGISSSTTAANFETLITSFGMSDKAAEATQRDMVDLARAIGLPPQQMMENFQSSMPILSKWGKSAPKIFKKVAIHAKKLGVEMGTLLQLGDQFDTFEGAASAVGKLNAMVGGDVLNAYDMMNMSLEDRNMAVKRAVELDGESWGSMNRMKQMAYANAAGITDMEQAHRLFGGASADSMSVEEKRAEAQMKGQKSMETAMTRTLTILEKFEKFLDALFGSKSAAGWADSLSNGLSIAHKYINEIRIALMAIVGLTIAWKARGLWKLAKGGMGLMGLGKSASTGMNLAKVAGGGGKNAARAARLAKGPVSGFAGSTVAKGLGKKGVAKGLGKTLAKKIPLLGLAAGIMFAADRAMAGDYTGAGLEVLSGAASTFPGLGTAASVAIDAGLMAKDMEGGMKGKTKSLTKAKAASSAQSGNAQFDALTRAFTTAINNAQGHDVILKIDGDEIGRFTEAYIGKKYKVS